MQYQLNVICSHSNKAEWGFWFTRFWIDLPFGLTMENCDSTLRPLWDLMRFLTKQEVIVRGIQWLDIASPQSKGGNGIATYWREGHGGLNPQHGNIFYRHVLQCSYEIPAGRHSKNWFRGCLDERDVIEKERNRISLKSTDYIEQIFTEFQNENVGSLWPFFITKPAFAGSSSKYAGTKPIKIWNYRAVNAHAITRIRGSIDSKGVEIGNSLINDCITFTALYQKIKAQVDSDGPHTFANVYEDAMGILGGIRLSGQKIQKYLTDADEDDSNGEVPPVSRFGFTGGSIKEIWKTQSDKAAKAVEQLPTSHHPEAIDASGDVYMKRDDSYAYLDEIKQMLEVLNWTCYFDAFNPHAYEGQEPNKTMADAPEFIKLAL